jgi:F-type H+-transporting ATPase subunit b
MLSRLTLRSGHSLPRALPALQVRETSSDVATPKEVKTLAPIIIKDGPERDLVNFPRPVRPIEATKCRMGFLPESWFTFFYPKTGVTGPYLFGAGLLTYCLSKEIIVMEHEYYNGLSILIMIIYATKKFGPGIQESLTKQIEDIDTANDKFQVDNIKAVEVAIKEAEKSQWEAQGQKLLFDAKKENVQMLLEANYRERLMQVYSEVKRRMDYQVEILNAEKRMQQKNMVNWIVSNVVKSITPQQEKETLQKCIGDLKALAAKAT